MPKYDETENILELYMHCVGESEIPKSWHKWTCLSMVAASLADRVYYRKFAWQVLPPNMYVMLVGDSGLGKGAAISFGMQFKHDRMHVLYGSATKQSLIDRMVITRDEDAPEDEVSQSKIFIVQDELAEAVGTGQMADAYIKAMTGWYGQTSNEIEENTRTHGKKIVEEPPCLNWLAGTTNEWLKDVVDYKAMLSGVFGRVCTVPGKNDFNNRIYKPEIVPDYDVVVQYLQERFEELTYYEGEMHMLPAARELDEEWYMNRPNPSEGLEPFWRREHALVLKLAMILSACDSLDYTIHPRHISAAQELVTEVRKYMPEVIERSVKGGVKTHTERVKLKIFDCALGISRTHLLRYMARHGVKARELDDMIDYLVEQELVEVTKTAGKLMYTKRMNHVIEWRDV